MIPPSETNQSKFCKSGINVSDFAVDLPAIREKRNPCLERLYLMEKKPKKKETPVKISRGVDLKEDLYEQRKRGWPQPTPSRTAVKFFAPFQEQREKVLKQPMPGMLTCQRPLLSREEFPQRRTKLKEDVENCKRLYQILYPEYDNFRKDFEEPESFSLRYRKPFVQGIKSQLYDSKDDSFVCCQFE
ncbi:hypothetical protein CAPTEDRAFT_194681 [Capitella teleta]|uniref:Uncharacterized protein n=1 Tax=Capitella teleta TaxID=283909 RepID=R7V150_CAPTE|nr:hypothetical protein CAPTEDRAFT_194681 [Capitella teleta]|eukprot:ELU09947.1 hypothetical protein CAPTEDRAFT_194681 [Capitella teleta]